VRRRAARPGGVGALVGLAAGLVALGPALAPGYLLVYDLVGVPDQPLTAAVLGTDGSVPRAVPNDLVVVLLSTMLPGDLVQKLLLLAAFVLGGWGVGRLMPTRLAAAVAAITLTWNAYLAERLAIGHWGFMLGLAALPWAAGSAAGVRRREPGAVPRLCLVLALSGLAGSTALVMVTLLVLVLMSGRGWRDRLGPLGWVMLTALGAAAPWVVPALRLVGSFPADPGGVPAFAARADTPLGLLPSLVTTGAIWNPAVWPGERGSVVVAAATLLLVVGAVVAGAGPWLRSSRATAIGVLVAGAVGLVVAVAGAVPGPRELVRVMVVDVSGGGLVRDGQKFVALAVLPLACCAGLAAQRARPYLRQGAWLLIAVPVAVLPSLAWGVHGRLDPATYPPSWLALRSEVDRATQDTPGAVAVFPFTFYRRYAWNSDHVVLDPVPRLLDAEVVENDDLPLADRVVRGEDPRAARIRRALAGGGDLGTALSGQGVRWVLEQRDQPDPTGELARLDGLALVWSQGDLALRRVPGQPVPPPDRQPPVGVVLGGVTLVTALGAVLLPWWRRRCYARAR
jgi:hypothetical protein